MVTEMGHPTLSKKELAPSGREWPAGCLQLPAFVELASAKKNCLTWDDALPG